MKYRAGVNGSTIFGTDARSFSERDWNIHAGKISNLCGLSVSRVHHFTFLGSVPIGGGVSPVSLLWISDEHFRECLHNANLCDFFSTEPDA